MATCFVTVSHSLSLSEPQTVFSLSGPLMLVLTRAAVAYTGSLQCHMLVVVRLCFTPTADAASMTLSSFFCPPDREPPAHVPLYPPSCDMVARSLPPHLLAPPPPNRETSGKAPDTVKMELEDASLWKQFTTVGTEMIITKKGR